ncbi:MAG: AAA family ATPase [Betaproteobacteria bacterium]|nr:AAA family ATPase [Betaproteobacteria bacterium]
MKYRLVLDLPVSNKLEEILSEGEQRAIAVGAFLAELRLASHGGGIVFDDPVSSLDHWRRRQVARRLVEEAKGRQVIILTHDTTFLGELRDAIEQLAVDHQMHHLEWMGNRPGFVFAGLPWAHKSYNERIDRLEKARSELERRWSAYPGEAEAGDMRHQYSFLRATIERVVQDLVLNGVVQRYRDWIRVDNLDEVVGFDAGEQKEIARLFKRCCDVVDAHDPASAKNAPVPNPTDLGSDLQSLKGLIAAIKARRAKGRQRRERAWCQVRRNLCAQWRKLVMQRCWCQVLQSRICRSVPIFAGGARQMKCGRGLTESWSRSWAPRPTPACGPLMELHAPDGPASQRLPRVRLPEPD